VRVLAYMADNQGCGMHRVAWPAAAVNGLCEMALGQAMLVAAQQNQPEPQLIAQEVAAVKPNVIVFQRPMAAPTVQLMRQLQRTGYAIVVDIDDDFTCLPESNPAHKATDPKESPIANRDNHWLACSFADHLTVSTQGIHDSYGGGDRVSIVRNRVPQHWLNVKMPKDDPAAVIWTAVLAYHTDDLDVTEGAVGIACSRAGAVFRPMGWAPSCGPKPEYDAKMAELGNAKGYTQSSPWLDLTGMPFTQIIGRSTAGIVPLCDRPFNRSKSWIKGLEYSALGVPFIASSLPEYQLLTGMGAGETAATPKEWRDKLERLLRDPEYRKERTEAGRDVARGLTYGTVGPEWVAAWEKAWKHSRTRMAA